MRPTEDRGRRHSGGADQKSPQLSITLISTGNSLTKNIQNWQSTLRQALTNAMIFANQ
jgi:hypothetical protein